MAIKSLDSIFKPKRIALIGVSNNPDSVGAVSYTHLDVYKRQIVYGPLLAGATTVMFEGIPTWPDAGRFWDIVDKYKVTHFYTAPTAIRALIAQGDNWVTSHDLSSLKVLGSVGEPINEEAWRWYHDVVGKGICPIVDTWWQTENGGIMISPLAGITPTKPSFCLLYTSRCV